ncbi:MULTISPECIES: iron-siderophore ABC transporter substrate-binding protein [Lysinibacillus]|jgi:iron complex transport system substrate-binding protein|uniref:Iron-siderophore ABC transporter substrate-binding protein n=1 Tax=Lysinibacillus fusiformis TaxID=28031 RepID=A0A2I0V3Y6_9BACI|nr:MULTISPECIES: iron-siderophore ABC transporter substrate-binding protein [Lysinibacillus]KUF36762.1 ABC transporter substrate-binding protein [Lysinibacillus sp. F5]MEE3807328.1 iron-siderophore ABC transporter substrate-binding protein [Lysinibacillus fusiformis]PKU52993.1 iron-siderophore ABC transporter substrate-binding protein [Lysinibacillus fusiformis]WCH49056.1 iron-siderophore ABC transporter substrate-binding protein [Lysinibacillus sp. OF-1]SCX95908.1 iron complex transport syste
MHKIKGLLFSTLLLAGILAGCNETSVEKKGVATEDTSTSAVNADATHWPRTIKDALGKEIVIEKKPEKIVSLWYFYPEILVALGEPPTASTDKEYLSSLSYLNGKLDSTEELGDKLSPSIEKILSTEPDYILATEHHEKLYESLEKVAPVITLKSKDIYDDWQYGLRTVAEIIGKEDEAEKVIDKMMQEITIGREALKSIQGESVALVLSWDGKTFNVLGEENPVYILAFDKEKGLGLTPDITFKGKNNQFTAFEGISTIQADHIFLIGDITKKETLMSELQQSNVWNNMNAVKKGNIHLMDTSAITGGPLAIEYALQNITNALQKQ